MTLVVSTPRRPTSHAFAVPVVREVPRPAAATLLNCW
ncbi:hypothetical protein C8N24_2970 [Solirubrobacter pauli]|uniref:Uncharacterized protein n=1 Tax=Solirubrobacter pauli TaxID=166793 RepID=A0A660LGP9_9ACTN|nr:hypothetical protein C8N24_2970 [Solirubrobacter pauli]